MTPVLRYPTSTDEEREKAVSVASLSIQRGELVVIPTDTVYGLAADAFDSDAVTDLLEAKGRGRDMPPPVLVSSATTLDALAVRVPAYARALVEKFWPGPLTLICHQQTSLQWDLGDTRGTVAVRMPDHPITLEILERTGPLAVSSANLTGSPAATDAAQAEEMLGDAVAIIVDAGPSEGGEASTIIDATGPAPRVLRAGALSQEQLDTVLGPLGLALSGDGISLAKQDDDTSTVALEKSPAEKKPAAKAPAKKAPAKKAAAKKAPATKAAAKEVPADEVAAGQTTSAPAAAEPTPAAAPPVEAPPSTPRKAPVKPTRVRKTTVMPPSGTTPSDPAPTE